MSELLPLIIRVIADGFVIPVVIIGSISFLLLVNKDRYQAYARAFMAGLTALFIAKMLSLLYQAKERPFELLGQDPGALYLDNPGFPSDHALFVTTITAVVWAATGHKKVAAVLLGMSLLVYAGRVVALVHTPLDIIGGVIAGLLGVAIWYGLGIFAGGSKRGQH